MGKIHGSESDDRFCYPSREWHEETRLYYYRARYYDPANGRFISEDPVRFRGGSNFYVYGRNDPITLTDPTGLAPTCDDKKRCPPAEKQRIYKALVNVLLSQPGASALASIPRIAGGGVVQLGLGGAVVFGFPGIPKWMLGLGGFTGSASLAFDKYGDVALVLSSSNIGNGLGGGAVAGAQLSVSPAADNVFQLGGWNWTGAAGGGAGLGGEFAGSMNAGGTATETVGIGAGGFGPSAFFVGSKVIPLVCP